MSRSSPKSAAASGLHPRNRHTGRYDFAALTGTMPELAAFVRPNPAGEPTIDFADPAAVLALNRALLATYYGVKEWAIPAGYLCPPIPGRADYLHHLADLLGGGAAIPRGEGIRVLDIGTGANCIYPLIGVAEYGWSFVATDVDPVAVASARRILAANPRLAARIDVRLQREPARVFGGVVRPGETFAACVCNPPFHTSAAEAAEGTQRKLRNLAGGERVTARLNFGGRANELWCAGGEVGFVRRMIAESAERPQLCGWFTTLVSKRDSLPPLYRALERVAPAEVKTLPLAHGQKATRVLAWRFGRQGT